MKNDIFKQARDCINPGLIEKLFSSPGAKWIKDEFQTLHPGRADNNIGSFHIKESGQWYDHAIKQGGDLIDLLCQRDNIDKLDAAKYIISQSGGIVPDKKQRKEKKKHDPVLPVPEGALKKLNEMLSSEWYIKNIGAVSGGWEYRDAAGKLLFVVARHEGKKKKIRPYYYSVRNRWESGNPISENIPLYGLSRLSDLPVLIVEGEKCADINVQGFSVLSWCGGTSQVNKTDWGPLEGRKITIWPDNDDPGFKAALQIKKILPESRILSIEDKPNKWDIADAVKDGIDCVKFIQECKDYEKNINVSLNQGQAGALPYDDSISQNEIEAMGAGGGKMPFRFMGFDDGNHYFLPQGSRTIKRIGLGAFGKGKLLEIAELGFWIGAFPRRGLGFDFDGAVDWIIRSSEGVGFFRPDSVRGTGVWMDDKKIIINNGDYIINGTGKPVKDIASKFFYVRSDRKMGKFDGVVATDDQGKSLINLFMSQGFETKTESWIACGWSLIAPFAGILNWRPHVWITGPTQCGKSFLLRELIHPICGPIAEIGTGKTSAPGVYRSLKSSAAPVILDEMEPGKNKESRLRIEEKLEIARNASSDFSANMSLANKSGGVDRFCIRSPFCFSSVIPYFTNEAIENRILICRLKSFSKIKNKRKNTNEILKTGLLADPGIFRRRIYNNLGLIMKNTEVIKKIIEAETQDNRKADNMGAIFASLFMIVDCKEVQEADIKETVIELLNNYESEVFESDEDKLIRHIFDHQIRLMSGEFMSIAEMILEAKDDYASEEHKNILLRHGMKIYKLASDDKRYLAIAKHHQSINNILDNTQYRDRYIDILRRHPASIGKMPSIRFAGQTKGAILLEWDLIENIYFSEQVEDDQTMEIPF